MDKTIVGVLAAIGSIAPMAAAHAGVTPTEVDRAMNASSFAELLQTVPNAPAILKAAKQQRAESPKGDEVQVAEHHHHHHYYHHHHHYHHHHYHHHHHNYY